MSYSFVAFLGAGLCALLLSTGIAEASDRGKWFDKLDQNQDGRVTYDEVAESRAARFARRDGDGDGFVTLEEMAAKHKDKGDPERWARYFFRLDANADERLSEEEYVTVASRFIERGDANGDGAIDSDEWQALREKYKKHKCGESKSGTSSE